MGVEYDGSAFHGWQRQLGTRTVQGQLEAALSKIADESVTVCCAGRTDAGVHASQQIVHFDTGADRSARSWVLGCNTNMPADVSVLWALPVADHFHARFSALKRSYDYVICNRQSRPSLWGSKVSWQHQALDPNVMQMAADLLIGEHDFSSFQAKGCQAWHPVRTIYAFDVTASTGFVVLSITANAFLQHMVRNLAGVLMDIGMGKHPPAWAAQVLNFRDRTRASVTASPHGLYLTAVHYPEEFGLPIADGRRPVLPCYSGVAFPG